MAALRPGWIQMPITGMKPRTALMGGSFDPPHIGHIHLIHEVAAMTPIERLIIVPANISNFKQGSCPASFSDRVDMLSLAIEDYMALYPDDEIMLEISRWEGERGGVSYTADTIRHFYSEAVDDGRVNFIIGDDILPDLEKWHDYGYLKDNVRFWCFSRDLDAEPPASALVMMVHSSVVTASSTAIRSGQMDMLSESVREYIDERGLYRAE